jgi:dimethylaniline monooxygenase (N-oxide forming)
MQVEEGETARTDNRLAGENVRAYMEHFAEEFLRGRISYNMVVTNIQRTSGAKGHLVWLVSARDRETGNVLQLRYHKIVLCTGVSEFVDIGSLVSDLV